MFKPIMLGVAGLLTVALAGCHHAGKKTAARWERTHQVDRHFVHYSMPITARVPSTSMRKRCDGEF
jgi:hypothetical protein